MPLILLALNAGAGSIDGEPAGDVLVPGYVALVIATSGLMALPSTIVHYRERGILRRLRVTPLTPLVALVAQVLVCLVVTLAGLALLVACGVAFST